MLMNPASAAGTKGVTTGTAGATTGTNATGRLFKPPTVRAPFTAGVSALSAAECKGLGGVVGERTTCAGTNLGCATTDANGVIRIECINEPDK
jgi:hypothetical protein